MNGRPHLFIARIFGKHGLKETVSSRVHGNELNVQGISLSVSLHSATRAASLWRRIPYHDVRDEVCGGYRTRGRRVDACPRWLRASGLTLRYPEGLDAERPSAKLRACMKHAHLRMVEDKVRHDDQVK